MVGGSESITPLNRKITLIDSDSDSDLIIGESEFDNEPENESD